MADNAALLYVDDDPADLELVEQVIAARTGVTLLRAASFKRALKLARAEPPEVMLLNIDLPGDAVQCIQLLRADPGTQDTPILALSANAAPDAMVKGLEAGFFLYLTKPMAAQPFMEALDYALEFAALQRAEH
jgi:DNA-binding response OmpR family regulator